MAIEPAESLPPAEESVERDDTYFLPQAAAEGKSVKPGDVIKFRVVGKDSDGNIEVEYYTDEQIGSGWQDDMRKSFDKPAPIEEY